eukprot:CAMPEP_0206380300 /NCGR_PEP_ID=MMETSP0294-20121207/11942_1 /ASSEMBLY_ACC=CAM_ASM_000327 /TAXON_ID=39354 /ORGANISM="Heterosigma akashiwo, Strain CCMP2393" /LENGTH=52 /DNA_ID=CAMNT_0053829483 /DNA_START=116 /DNA_END=274 /DNA_ORIENTATION=-
MRVITTPAAMQHGGGDLAAEVADTHAVTYVYKNNQAMLHNYDESSWQRSSVP